MAKRAVVVLALWIGVFVSLPISARAQELGTIAGAVRDATDAVLPGVTVEVASPALIERVRTATTDGSGQYRIINLPPGVYRVSFSLPGFSTQARENVELRTNFTANVNGTLSIGQQNETIQVVAESPIVDVQSVVQSRAITAQQIKEIPSGGGLYQLAALVPGVITTLQDVGGSSGESPTYGARIHARSGGDTQSMLDGLKLGNLFNGGGNTNIMPLGPLFSDQIDMQTSGQSADAATVGLVVNSIPKSGGNQFSGSLYGNFANNDLQGKNLSDEVRALGLQNVNEIRLQYDVSGAFGGPVRRDKMWFYATVRRNLNDTYVAGQYFPTDVGAFVRVPDLTRRSTTGTDNKEFSTRGTVALTASQKLMGLYYYQPRITDRLATNPGIQTPEATVIYDMPGHFTSGAYTNALSNRLLLEGAFLYSSSRFTWRVPPEVAARNAGLTPLQIIARGLVPIDEQGGTLAPTMRYRGPTDIQHDHSLVTRLPYRASLSYTTGSHNVKVGFDNSVGTRETNATYAETGFISYRTQNFVPNQLTLYAPPPQGYAEHLDLDLGIYAQDRWTRGRMTATYGLRVEMLRGSYDPLVMTPTQWIPQRGSRPGDSYPGRDKAVDFKDLSPRFGLAYDLFGDGRTSLKASAVRGLYQEATGTVTNLSPAAAVATTTSRAWTDVNQNFIPDCDLVNAAAQSPTTTGSIDICGPNLNSAFGATGAALSYNPDLLSGWGKRPWIWDFSVGLQRQILPRAAVAFNWYRTVEGNFRIIDNQATTAADYRPYTVVVPNDPRLPNAGQRVGQSVLYDIVPSKLGQVSNYVTHASDYGKRLRHYDGYDVTLDARPTRSLYVQGGVAAGSITEDFCALIPKLPELATVTAETTTPGFGTPLGVLTGNGSVFCHTESGFRPQYKFLGSYELPWWGIRTSAALQSMPGPNILANVVYLGADILAANPSLGAYSGAGGNRATIGVVAPGTMVNDRLTQVDVKFAKVLRFGGRAAVDLAVDVFNLFNGGPVLNQTNTYSGANGGAWLRPLAVNQARFVKFTARWDF